MAVPNEHLQARRLIQLQLDGVLAAEEAAWLETHLPGCPDCQQYAAQHRQLDAALRLDFQAAREAAAHSPHRRPGDALDPIRPLSRPRMNPRSLRSFANTLVSIALLVAMTGGLAWLLSSQLRPPLPGSAPQLSTTPTAAATATPLPTPTPVPLPAIDSQEQIIQTLQILANAEMAQFAGSGWAHYVTQNLPENGSGALQGTFVESWMRFDQGVCIEGYMAVKERADGEQYHQLLVSLPDGVAGDLAALRQGTASLEGDLSWSLPCAAGPTVTDAGRLAARLERGAAAGVYKGPNDLQKLQAWYEDQDTRPVLVVEAEFTQTGSAPEVQRETHRFDLGTGTLLQEHIWMEWANGAPFGEMSHQQRLEIVDALPAAAAEFYAQSAAELRSYVDPSSGQVTVPTGTPLPVGDAGEPLSLLYTAADPLTDVTHILSALEAIHQNHFAWLSKPGWHLYTPKLTDGSGDDTPFSELLHTLPDGTCEWFTFQYRDGVIAGDQFFVPSEDWVIEASGAGAAGVTPCRIDNFATMDRIKGVLGSANEILSGKVAGEMRMWVEERDSRPVIVLHRNVTYASPKPSTLDPDTRQLEIQDRSENWDFFDMETGTPVDGGESYQAYLANGKVFGEPYQPGGPTTRQLIDYDTLPAAIAQAFGEMVARMRGYVMGQPTATPLPTRAAPFDAIAPANPEEVIDSFQSTADAPLTDPEAVLRLFLALHQRHVQWLAQPGWHLYAPQTLDRSGNTSTYSELLRAYPDGTCDRLSFYYPNGDLQASELHLASGDWGLIGSVEAGKFTEGERAAVPCQIDHLLSVTHLKSLIWSLDRIHSGETPDAAAQAWLETRDGQPVMVLYLRETHAAPLPETLDPSTGQLVPMQQSEEWHYLDLQTGAQVSEAARYHLENGQVVDDQPAPGGYASMHLVDYATLPPELAQAFEQMVSKLQEFLETR